MQKIGKKMNRGRELKEISQNVFPSQSRRVLFDAYEFIQEDQGTQNSSLSVSVSASSLSFSTPPTSEIKNSTAAPKKNRSKEINRENLRPKKLVFNPENSSPFQTENNLATTTSLYRSPISSNSNVIRVFRDHNLQENRTSLRTQECDATRCMKNVILKPTSSQRLSINKENDRLAIESVPKSSKLKHKVVHSQATVAEFNSNSTSPKLETSKLSNSTDSFSWEDVIVGLRTERDVGLWVECCRKDCKKWRYVEQFHDPMEVPEIWYCEMNQNNAIASCTSPEVPIPPHINDDIIENKYNAGSIVWAHVKGFPWWPAIVCDSPETYSYYQLNTNSIKPHSYHVVFFDESVFEYAWIKTRNLHQFTNRNCEIQRKPIIEQEFKVRWTKSCELAESAKSLSIVERLQKFDFLAWHNKLANTQPIINSDDFISEVSPEQSSKRRKT